MEVISLFDKENSNGDNLTHNIFSLLESKFLFGSDKSKIFFTGKPNSSDEIILKNPSKADVGKVRILSIDGSGSTDGALAAISLVYLESYLCQKSQNPDARIADFFDVGTGTGIGGILVSMLFTKGENGRSLFKASEALQFIVKNRMSLVSSSSKKGILGGGFCSSKTKKLFRKMFGESTLKDTLKPVLIPSYDLSTRATFLFSRTDAMENDGFNFKMSEVCEATIADPMKVAFRMSSVDKKTKIVAVDGGLAMNNPTAAAITHVLNNKKEFPFCGSVQDLLVVSLGNGVLDSRSAPNFIKIGGEASSEMIDESVAMAFGGLSTSNYVRIQANGFSSRTGKTVLENADQMLSQKSVESALFKGKKLSEQTNSEKIESFARELIMECERRKTSILPTVTFKNSSSPRRSSATASTISSY